MKKLKFNPFIIPAAIALIGIGKYSFDTISVDKAELAYVDEYTSDEELDCDCYQNNSNQENNVQENQVKVIDEVVEEKSSELLDQGYDFENIDFDKLNQTNPDVVGWLTIDGVINEFPIVQGVDNEEYLHANLEGEYDSKGTPFMDYKDDPVSVGDNELAVIYGHHLKNNKCFSNLCNYKDEDYVNEHPYGVYYTENGEVYMIKFFAGIVVGGTEAEYLNIEELDEKSYNEFISSVESMSSFSTDVDVEYGDDLLALVTCSYETSNSRYILYGKLEKQYTDYKEINDNKLLSRH